MPRAPKLYRHEGHWYTKAGNPNGVYFGRCDEVSHDEAKKLFHEYLASLNHREQIRSIPQHSVIRIAAAHLRWVRQHRSPALFRQRRSLLRGFCEFIVGGGGIAGLDGQGEPMGHLRASLITRRHVEDYIAFRTSQECQRPLGDKAVRAVIIALKATWNWAADSTEDGGGGFFPAEHRPLARMSRGFVQPKDLTEVDLPTDQEIEILFRWAMVDVSKVRAGTGRWRERRPDEHGVSDQWQSFADMLRVYHATGARTSELCGALVRDFMPRTKQLCLGKHKRVRTQSNPSVRNIQLGDETFAILVRNVQGKSSSEPLFSRASGTAWTQEQVNERLRAVKKAAAKHQEVVRQHITPYSFRDLYITELLMLGVPTFQVAKMAGTSLREIERTYGHFFNHDLAIAQAKLDAARRERRTG